MRSVRLSKEVEKRLAEASRMTGLPVSQIIREAIEAHCDRLLGESFAAKFADLIGSVDSGGGRNSRKTGREFATILEAKEAKRRRRRKAC
jgi:predicted DNA-binding protein